MKTQKHGFTLVELLVVMSILGVLVAIIAGNFRSAQIRGRDAQRKSDLKQLSESLELFYADYGKYPPESAGRIAACAYNPTLGTGTPCVWGSGSFTDNKTVYFKIMPSSPSSDSTYLYRLVPSGLGQKYQLFARLENSLDQDIIVSTQTCGTAGTCNFSLTSPNTDPSEN
jgi:prepilin-type N-terminal cleavage/methylation domain-containing protein